MQTFARLLLALSVVVATRPAAGQTVTGVISGVVTDASGAVIPDAKITALNVETGLVRSTVTNQQGIFSFLALPVGTYNIRAERPGFSTAVKEKIVLEVDRTVRVDATMAVGSVVEQVEVLGGAAQLLKAETSDLGQVINQRTVENLPLNGREFWTLALLSAGVTNGTAGMVGPAFRTITANGQRADANLFTIDGLDNREMDANQDQITPNLDSIAEFAVHTNTYSANLGSAAGAIINVHTRSGTNQFHGTAFEFFRNDVLDAANFFVNKLGLKKNPLRFNQFGGTMGGPIRRDRTFFFADYQGDRIRRGAVQTATVPTLARRQGDFSDLLAGPSPVQLVNPRTGQAIPGNVIPRSLMDPAAAELAALYPAPNLPGTRLNYAALLSNPLRRDAFSAKVDQLIGSSDALALRYYYLSHERGAPVAFGPVLGGPPVLGGSEAIRRHAVAFSEVHQFGPATVNEFRAGWNFGPREVINTDFNEDLGARFGIPNITVNDVTRGLPWIVMAGGGSDFIGSSLARPQFLGAMNYEFKDVLGMTRGRHRLQFGADFVRRQLNVFQAYYPRGNYVYLGQSSLQSVGRIVPGADVADFLLGVPFSLQRDYMRGKVGLRAYEFSAFAQDDIKVSPRLTLNAGVRYDLYPPWVEVADRMSNFAPATATLIQAGGPLGRRLVQTDKNNVSPRFGFAYALTADSRTLLRGGFGLFYFDVNKASSTFSKLIYNPPNYYLQKGPNFPLAPALSQGFPIAPAPPLDRPSGSVLYQPSDNVTSYSGQWNINLQREFAGQMFVEVAYVGTRGLHLPLYINPNQPFINDSGQRVRLYGEAISGLKTWTTTSSSTYHALQAKVERRLSRGVQFLASYTHSKSIDDNSIGAWSSATDFKAPQNSFDRRADRALSSFDVRNRLVLSYIWEIPFLRKASSPVVRAVLAGWQINGITTLQDGQPLTPTITAAQAGLINPLFNDPRVTDIGELRPNVLRKPNLPSGERSVDRWYDVTALDTRFTGRPRNESTFGNAGRNIIEGPGVAATDLSVFKEFMPAESVRLQFRAEMFNIFNRVNLDPPIRTVDLNGGRILTARPAREIQLGLKLLF